MRKIYLIRHSQPEFPDGRKMCIGTTDLPLGRVGKMQSVLLAETFKEKKISAVYSSDLRRSIETALFLTDKPKQMEEFREADCGAWDGLTFAEIKERWPEIYQLRGEDLSYPIPKAESLEEVKKRFESGIKKVLSEETEDFAIVGHATSLKVFLCGLIGIEPKFHRTIPMDYASVTTICVEECFKIEKRNECLVPELSEELCRKLLDTAETPAHVQRHCFAVRKQAEKICEALKDAGIKLDEEMIYCGAMLHDIARTEKSHAKTGGEWVTKVGYPMIGELIASHHKPDFYHGMIDEKAVLIMADSTVMETEVVSIEQRFEKSMKKCKTEESLKMHEERYRNTVFLKNKINDICAKEILL